MAPPPRHGRLLFPSLVAVSFAGPLCIHLFLPGMSAVKTEFGVSTGMAQLTLSLVMFVMAGTTLVYGALSDRLGRRKVLLAGLALFTLGAALSSVAPDIWTLLAGRTLQGLGAGCGVVLARAIARDVYGLDRLPQIIAWLTAAYVSGPLVAPPLGGFLTDALGWRSPLIVAAVLGAAILALVAAVVKETLAEPPASPPGMFRGYRQLLRRRRFVGFVLMPGFLSAAFFVNASAGLFLATEVLHRSATEYGLWFSVFPVGYMAGNFISGRVGARASIEFMTIVGSLIGITAGLLLAGLLYFGPMTMASIFLPGFFLGIAQGMCMPYAQTGATRVNPALAGSASGAVVFCQFFFPAVLVQLAGELADGTWVPMAAIVLGCGVCSLLAGLVAITDRVGSHGGPG